MGAGASRGAEFLPAIPVHAAVGGAVDRVVLALASHSFHIHVGGGEAAGAGQDDGVILRRYRRLAPLRRGVTGRGRRAAIDRAVRKRALAHATGQAGVAVGDHLAGRARAMARRVVRAHAVDTDLGAVGAAV